MPAQTIAIIEDEQDILDVIEYNLKREGFRVISSNHGEEGIAMVEKQEPDLLLLDLMLPGANGIDVCKALRSNSTLNHMPIIMVTAKGEESDIVLGLEVGADDYISKPFSPKELVARVKAALRRSSKEATPTVVDEKVLLINADKHEVTLNGAPLKLTATEFRILECLASQPGRVFTREQLLNNSVGDNIVVVDRNIDVHIRAIRKKLQDHQDLIETIRGIGYRFKE